MAFKMTSPFKKDIKKVPRKKGTYGEKTFGLHKKGEKIKHTSSQQDAKKVEDYRGIEPSEREKKAKVSEHELATNIEYKKKMATRRKLGI